MRILVATLKVAVFLLLLGFALKNTDSVVVEFFAGVQWQAPLVLVLLVAFGFGIAAGVMGTLGIILRQRREILALKRAAGGQAQASPASAAGESA